MRLTAPQVQAGETVCRIGVSVVGHTVMKGSSGSHAFI